MSTKTSIRRTLTGVALAGAVAAIPFTLAAPASAAPAAPSATEIRHDRWDHRDCRHPWSSRHHWNDRCDRWRGHHPGQQSFWRPGPSISFGSS